MLIERFTLRQILGNHPNRIHDLKNFGREQQLMLMLTNAIKDVRWRVVLDSFCSFVLIYNIDAYLGIIFLEYSLTVPSQNCVH